MVMSQSCLPVGISATQCAWRAGRKELVGRRSDARDNGSEWDLEYVDLGETIHSG